MRGFNIKICLLPLLMFLTGCPYPPRAIPVDPSKIEDVSPKVVQVHSTTKKVGVNNKTSEGKLKDQDVDLAEQKKAIVDTRLKVEELVQKLPVDSPLKKDAENLVTSLKKLEETNTTLEKRNGELVILNKDQKKLLEQLEEEINNLKDTAKLKDNEVAQLRNQSAQYANKVAGLEKDLSKSKVSAAKAGVYRNWIFGIVGAFVLWTIVKNILMVYLPTTKFRL